MARDRKTDPLRKRLDRLLDKLATVAAIKDPVRQGKQFTRCLPQVVAVVRQMAQQVAELRAELLATARPRRRTGRKRG
jgi:hypothetical protein